jgi:hypothetical protein
MLLTSHCCIPSAKYQFQTRILSIICFSNSAFPEISAVRDWRFPNHSIRDTDSTLLCLLTVTRTKLTWKISGKTAKIPIQFSQTSGINLNPGHLAYIRMVLITWPRLRYITLHGFTRAVFSNCFSNQHSSNSSFRLCVREIWDLPRCYAALPTFRDNPSVPYSAWPLNIGPTGVRKDYFTLEDGSDKLYLNVGN